MQDVTVPPPDGFTVLEEADMRKQVLMISRVHVYWLPPNATHWSNAGSFSRTYNGTIASYTGNCPAAIPDEDYERLFGRKEVKPVNTRWPNWDLLCKT